jgi:dTDP-4-amino-4,6-dideoxy-D-galactose acyltransferase
VDLLKLLEWDTKFFGFPVAKILNAHAQTEELREAVSQLRSQQIPLAYWFADKPSAETHSQIVGMGGDLVDEKLTFVARLDNLPEQQSSVPLSVVEPYREEMPLSDLKQLAVESGIHSRFVVDTKFPQATARAMFEEWIIRSVDKAVADEVLVIRQDSSIVGMVTIATKGNRGSIGLLAVAERCRGRQFGQALVVAAQNWCRDRSFREMQVITQQANVAAQRLYYKCGFQLEQMEACYHIWSTASFLPAQ